MALARIRRPEQLRHHPPGELGKTIGLDRVPEVRTLREKIAHIAATGNPTQWMRDLAKTWMENDPAEAVRKLQLTACDIAFLDTAPSFLDLITEAAEVADLMIIPTKASTQDAESTMDAVAIAERQNTPLLCVFNDINKRDGTLDACRKLMIRSQITLATTVIHHRVSHVHGFSFGLTAAEYKNGADGDAAAEINNLWLEIKTILEAQT